MTTFNSGRPAQTRIPAGVAEFVHDLARLWDRQLGENLCGVYLIGSLAHGGYCAQYSDIDVALIAERPCAGSDVERLKLQADQRWGELGSKLSLFWTDADFSVGRFPILDRVDYLDHAVTLLERRHVGPARPTLQEVRAHLLAEPMARWSEQVAHFAALDELGRDGYRPFLRALLYPARFLYSWETGLVASNDDAVAYVRKCELIGAEIDIVTRALHCRNEGGVPAHLFSERNILPRLLGLCVERIRKSLADEGGGSLADASSISQSRTAHAAHGDCA